MITLADTTRALNYVRSGQVLVNDRALNKLLSVFLDAHSTEFFNEQEMDLVQLVLAEGKRYEREAMG